MLADSTLASLLRGQLDRVRDVAGHVLDGHAGGPAGAVRQVAAQPVRSVARQRRDDDLVGAVELMRVDDRGQRVWMRHVARDVETRLTQLAQRLLEPFLSALGGRSL